MSRTINFTQAQIRRAVKAVEATGLRVRRVTISPDGSITIDGDNDPVVVDSEKPGPTSWDDV